jgi:hypothetical protein
LIDLGDEDAAEDNLSWPALSSRKPSSFLPFRERKPDLKDNGDLCGGSRAEGALIVLLIFRCSGAGFLSRSCNSLTLSPRLLIVVFPVGLAFDVFRSGIIGSVNSVPRDGGISASIA